MTLILQDRARSPLVRETALTGSLLTPEAPIAPQRACRQFSQGSKRRSDNVVVVDLNAQWRVEADPRQWMLARRLSNGAEPRWRPQKFITGRDHLLRRIAELCGKVQPEVLAEIRSWPKLHAIWWLYRTGQPTPGIAQALDREPRGSRKRRKSLAA